MTNADIPSLPSWKLLLGVIGAFFAVTLLVYGHSIKGEFVRWDDGMLVYENPAIREISPRTIKHIFTTYDPELYIPLTFFTYQLDYQIGGIHATQYHFTNFLLHTFNAILVAWLVFLLSRKGWIGIVCGLLFALHPLHTEAIQWVSARKDLLSTFFFLLTIVGYIYWKDRDDRRIFIASIIAFTLGLLSKVMIITLPVILLLIDYLDGRLFRASPGSPLRGLWPTLKEKIPYFALAALFGIIGIFGKTGVIQSSTLSGKILMACKSAVFYLQQMFFPAHFSLLYPYIKPITITSPDFYVPILVLLALAACAIYSLRRTRAIVFGLLFYLITVAPTFLNFAKGGEMDVYFASDRYAYIPSIGIFFAAVWLLYELVTMARASQKKNREIIVTFIAAVVLLACAGKAYAQSLVWKNTQALFENVIRYYPESSHVAHNNLGNVYRLQGDLDAAEDEYRQAIAIRPHAKTISNLGVVYRRQGKLPLALSTYDQALKADPNSKEAHLGLGLVHMTEKKFSEAAAQFQQAVTIDPLYEEGFTNLGAAYVALGRVPEAIEQYRKALVINQFFPDAHYNLAVALSETGDTEGAIKEYEETVRLVPTVIPARINLGILYHGQGRIDDARRQFEEILKIDPANKAARSALGQMGAGS